MKCSQCGSENNAGINYCTSCGNDLNAQANGEAVLVDNNPQATETVFAKMPEKFIQGESVFQTLEETQRQQMQQVPIGANIDPDVANVNPITFGRPKKSIMPKILVLLGVLFIAGGLLVAIFFKDIQKAVVGQAKFYVMQESKSIKTGTEGAQKNFVSLMNQSMNVSGTAKLIGPEELMSQFLNMEFNFTYDNDIKKNMAKTRVMMKTGESSTLDFLVQEANEKIGVSVGSTPDKQVVIASTRFISSLLAGDESEIKKCTGMSKADLKKMAERYFENVIVKSIPKENITTDKADFEGNKCDTTKFVIDAKVIKAAGKAMSLEIISDKELDTLITNFLAYIKVKQESMAGIDGMKEKTPTFPTKEEVKTAIKDFAKDMETTTTTESASYTVYYGKGNKVVNREIKDGTKTLVSIATYKENCKNLTRLTDSSTKNPMVIENRATESNDNYAATLTVNVGGEKVLSGDYNFKKNEKVGGILALVGKADFTLHMEGNEVPVKISSTKKGNDAINVKATATVSGKEMGFSADLKLSDKPNVSDVKVQDKSTVTSDELLKSTVGSMQMPMPGGSGGSDLNLGDITGGGNGSDLNLGDITGGGDGSDLNLGDITGGGDIDMGDLDLEALL